MFALLKKRYCFCYCIFFSPHTPLIFHSKDQHKHFLGRDCWVLNQAQGEGGKFCSPLLHPKNIFTSAAVYERIWFCQATGNINSGTAKYRNPLFFFPLNPAIAGPKTMFYFLPQARLLFPRLNSAASVPSRVSKVIV